ncbi:Rho-binding antiterminator [Pseudoalteromonas luteoviolacea]|uniref:Rho-binding antiterminator n=1 Tax=Pseudoalteromonas luteoviolacea TaxID=43657 RepID=UPI001F2B402B|nr:Rho-binding antiterminator [Pseudoalteromonas luteoviolacea]MCF6441292.1 Rho-binding antiterminator [Pseudoalteromonas luteoviolacea]
MKCEQSDLIEIACMKYFILRVETETEAFEGRAKDIVYDEKRIQCLVIEQGSEEVMIELDAIKELTAVTQNPFFETIRF